MFKKVKFDSTVTDEEGSGDDDIEYLQTLSSPSKVQPTTPQETVTGRSALTFSL